MEHKDIFGTKHPRFPELLGAHGVHAKISENVIAGWSGIGSSVWAPIAFDTIEQKNVESIVLVGGVLSGLPAGNYAFNWEFQCGTGATHEPQWDYNKLGIYRGAELAGRFPDTSSNYADDQNQTIRYGNKVQTNGILITSIGIEDSFNFKIWTNYGNRKPAINNIEILGRPQ